ncbi:MAG: homoserine dehydrogenase [Ruminococcaceae bacterium]|nr:homoserine dehydrogenase [Oscillospiraceae bacterium]
MTNVAILGFGVVGGGVADLLTKNSAEVKKLGGDEINIKYILDLRDFPDSPFADKVVHDYNVIVDDPEVDCIIEVMGGSHPAYEYTMAALKAGKSVITSNKEVVANFGDEFLAAAEASGVSYRFEAAVGGGIPVISPMINCIGQNKITEVRGILNGTTNYILTKMFSFGAGFEESLKDAQERGYAERNPDADILGTDACRKIAILSSLATGRLVPTENIHTEGITGIRKADVKAAEKLGMSIKLLGRSIIADDGTYIMVAPFMIGKDSPLSNVSGVYNAIEVLGEPIGSVMFYGPGAGAGATASAVVGDLMQVMCSGRACAQPTMIKSLDGVCDFAEFESRQYIALSGADQNSITASFGEVQFIPADEEIAFITKKMREGDVEAKLESLGAEIKSRIRLA